MISVLDTKLASSVQNIGGTAVVDSPKSKRIRRKGKAKAVATATDETGDVVSVKGPTQEIAEARLAVLVLPLGKRAGGAGHIIGRVLAACGVTDRKAAIPSLPELADRLERLSIADAIAAGEAIFANWSDPKTIARSRETLANYLGRDAHRALAKALRVLAANQAEDFSVTIRPPNDGEVTYPINARAMLNDIAGWKATQSRLFKSASSGNMA